MLKIEAEEYDESVVSLDPYNSDLNLVIDGDGYGAHPLTHEGFAFMWAGARGSHGVSKGKVCFEVQLKENHDVSHLPADEPNPHVLRVGFSVESSTLQLGEDPLSYGYGGTGKISTNCQFKDFGGSFAVGDVVLSLLDMSSDPVQIGFAKKGQFLGWAYKIPKHELKDQALFPHILTKNISFQANFGQMEKPMADLPTDMKDFSFIGCISMDQRVSGMRAPKNRADCEMIMMCGLPGAGKSVWAEEYSKKHPEKKYNVLGTNNIIDKMKVMGLPRKRNYHGRWDVLIQMATKCLNKMLEIGSKLRRNYILDQTNVYPSAQKRKMRQFDGFHRIAVVVVPTDDEYKKRCDKRDREEGKMVPDSAVLEMKANFKLPEKGDVFDEIMFTELSLPEAQKLVVQYNDEGVAAVGPPRKQFKSNDSSGYQSGRRDNAPSRWNKEEPKAPTTDQGGFKGGRGSSRGDFNGSGRISNREQGGFPGGRGFDNGGRGHGGNYDSHSHEGRGAFRGGSNYRGQGGSRDGFNSGGRGGFNSRGRGGSHDGFNSRGRGGSRDGFNSRGRGGFRDNYNNGGSNDRGFGGRSGGYDGGRQGGYNIKQEGYSSRGGFAGRQEDDYSGKRGGGYGGPHGGGNDGGRGWYNEGQESGFGQRGSYRGGQSGSYGSARSNNFPSGQSEGYGSNEQSGNYGGRRGGYGNNNQRGGYGGGQRGRGGGYNNSQESSYGNDSYGSGESAGYGSRQTEGYGSSQRGSYGSGEYGNGQRGSSRGGRGCGYGSSHDSGYTGGQSNSVYGNYGDRQGDSRKRSYDEDSHDAGSRGGYGARGGGRGYQDEGSKDSGSGYGGTGSNYSGGNISDPSANYSGGYRSYDQGAYSSSYGGIKQETGITATAQPSATSPWSTSYSSQSTGSPAGYGLPVKSEPASTGYDQYQTQSNYPSYGSQSSQGTYYNNSQQTASYGYMPQQQYGAQ